MVTVPVQVGFTGTREGMSDAQQLQLRVLLRLLGCDLVLHHGGAEGADMQADILATAAGCGVRKHLPVAHTARALLDRNKDIVDTAELLIAAPRNDKKEQRSGTWMTVRYARTAGNPVIMLSRGEP